MFALVRVHYQHLPALLELIAVGVASGPLYTSGLCPWLANPSATTSTYEVRAC